MLVDPSANAYPKLAFGRRLTEMEPQALPIPLERLTGIRSRRVASHGQSSIDLAREAAQLCLARSRYTPADIDVLISCSISKANTPTSAMVEPMLAFLLQQTLGMANALAFDVTDEAAIKTAFAALDARGVAVDILVNNAGIQFRKPMVELETADWQRVIDTNLTSAFMIGREAARRMIQRGHGKIVNIGSLTSTLARATVAPYTVAKGGIKMLTQAMAAEWAEHGLQANAIGPGYMITDMNEALIANPEFDAWVKGRTPARRWGRPQELVGAAVFLASSASDYVNGQIIYVDGGMLAVL